MSYVATARGTLGKAMFVVGLTMALLAAGFMVYTDIETGVLSFVGIMGILLIGTSGFRLLR